MIIRALLPFENWEVEFFEIEGSITNGQILMFGEERYALAINQAEFDVGKVKKAWIPENIEVLKFWIQMETYILYSNLTIHNRVLKEYRSTKGNGTLPLKTIENKIKRNLLLSHRSYRVPVTDQAGIILQYGYLKFILHKESVVHLKKATSVPKGWKKSEERYNHFSRILEVEGA